MNCRALLLLQDHIVQLEESLHQIDAEARRGPDQLGDSSSVREDPRPERIEKMRRLVPLLQQYSESVRWAGLAV